MEREAGIAAPDWPDQVFLALLAMHARLVAYVPDAGLTALIEACRAEPTMTAVPLTTEEEGIGVLAGAWLGGRRGVLLMQSSGIGNCVNTLTLARTCRFPLLMLVTMRGEWGEANPWQVPMGENAAAVLRLAGVSVQRAETAAAVGPAVEAAGRMVFSGAQAAAVLIAQSVVGAKTFEE